MDAVGAVRRLQRWLLLCFFTAALGCALGVYMSSVFAGVAGSAVFPTSLTLPVDGDPRNAASVRAGMEQTAHNLEGLSALYAQSMIPGGRLAGGSSSPMPVPGQGTASSTIYYGPYLHPRVPLWDGTRWTSYLMTASISQALSDTVNSPAAAIADRTYDLFVWLKAGVLTLSRGPAWAEGGGVLSDRGAGAGTSQLYALTSIGRYVNMQDITNGPLSGRGLYVGTIRTNSSNQVTQLPGSQLIWNKYNRVRTGLTVNTTADFDYTTNTPTELNAACRIPFVRGLAEDELTIEGKASVYAAGAAGADVLLLVGVGSAVAGASGGFGGLTSLTTTLKFFHASTHYESSPGVLPVGPSFAALLGQSTAVGTTRWMTGARLYVSGMF